ncbi:MAG: DUF6265 family protein [Planctomycetota bacterium]
MTWNPILPICGLLAVLSSACVSTPSGPIQPPEVQGGSTLYVLKPGDAQDDSRVTDLGWLAGRWIGEGFGGDLEETWLPPRAGRMVGTFTYYGEDGTVVFHEFMVLTRHEDRIAIRVLHINPDMTPWEAPGETTDFRLLRAQGNTAWFGGLTIHRAGDELVMHLAMEEEDGTISDKELRFWLDRPAPRPHPRTAYFQDFPYPYLWYRRPICR